MRAVRLAASALVLAAGLLPSTEARACATCGCGDPTLTALGVEKPLRNRVRLSIEERFGGNTVGEGAATERTWTLRTSMTAAWSPISRLTIAALVPVVSSWFQAGSQPWQNATGLGDAEVSVRGVVFQERNFNPHHLVSLLAGLKMPTGPRIADAQGYPYSEDDQPGSASWDPFGGAAYGYYSDRASLFASVAYRHTTEGRRGYRRGSSLGGTVGLQVQPHPRVALGVALDVAWSAPDSLPSGAIPSTGGTILALTPSLVVSPVTNWILKLGYQAHLVDWLNGVQAPSNALFLSTVVDLN